MTDELTATAQQMVTGGRGILAADESVGTMSKRLEKAGVEPTEENRRAYREMLVTTADLDDGVSGVILCDETFRQVLSDGQPFPEAIAQRGILTGIKVDTGAKPLAGGASGEKVTEGLDGLRERLQDYAALGARFAKWRAVISPAPGGPTEWTLRANAHALARYASLCQEAGVVPIVEPEVLMDGEHAIERCADVTAATLLAVMQEMRDAGVDLAGSVLKPNMVVSGLGCPDQAEPDEVARRTVETLREVVPPEVAGVAFLSGGQKPETATENLAAISAVDSAPWPLTFSFGRALVDPALAAWHGDPDRVQQGQRALAERVVATAAVVGGGRPGAREHAGAGT